MTNHGVNADAEEITVRMPLGMVDGIDEVRLERKYSTRSEVVAEAIHEAAKS